jgi:hypothetical protein
MVTQNSFAQAIMHQQSNYVICKDYIDPSWECEFAWPIKEVNLVVWNEKEWPHQRVSLLFGEFGTLHLVWKL